MFSAIAFIGSSYLLLQKLFMQGYGGNLSKTYLKANMLAGEAVGNIRTVAAFCGEEKILDLYASELVEPSKRSFARGQIAGIFYGISQFFIFSSYGLALWYVALASFLFTFCMRDVGQNKKILVSKSLFVKILYVYDAI